MSRTGFGFLGLVLGLALTLEPAAASAADKSSPQDRARLVSIARSLEEAPFKSNAKADREWALNWLTEAPDVSVSVCLDSLSGLDPDSYQYSGEVLFQYMFSMAALVIEHPEAANDSNAQQLAGVE